MADLPTLLSAAAEAMDDSDYDDSDDDSDDDEDGDDNAKDYNSDNSLPSSRFEIRVDGAEPPKKRMRRTLHAETAAISSFTRHYLVPAHNNPDKNSATSIWNDESALGKKFRLRFRLPYSLFNYNCVRYEQECEDRGVQDATGKKSYGVRILALGTLRMLGRDIMFDDLEDLNGISSETNRKFFHGFVTSLWCCFTVRDAVDTSRRDAAPS
jgi:hypothetical protein